MLYQNLQKFVKVNLRRAVVPTHTQFNLCELFSRQPLFPTGLLSKVYPETTLWIFGCDPTSVFVY